jgi:hypothetical protein
MRVANIIRSTVYSIPTDQNVERISGQRNPRSGRHPFLASFLFFAQYAFILFDCAFRAAAVIPPLCPFGVGAGTVVEAIAESGFFGGLPLRLAP